MKSNYSKTKIGGAILGFSLMLVIGMMSSITAQAQYPNNDQYRRGNDQYRQDRNQRGQDDRWNNQDQRGRDDRWNNRNRGRTWDGYPNYGGTFELRQTALNEGYNEGIKEGRKDRGHNDRYDFRDEGAYQNATKSYSSRLGDRFLYQRYFRMAFENGYRAGYSGY
jgi:hypothetical protein